MFTRSLADRPLFLLGPPTGEAALLVVPGGDRGVLLSFLLGYDARPVGDVIFIQAGLYSRPQKGQGVLVLILALICARASGLCFVPTM